MPVEGIRRAGRSTQGVIVMRLRGDERVSALAPVVSGDEAEDELVDGTVDSAVGGNGASPETVAPTDLEAD
jgi:DNA gyrase subunit A